MPRIYAETATTAHSNGVRHCLQSLDQLGETKMADNHALPKHLFVVGDYLVDAEPPAAGRE